MKGWQVGLIVGAVVLVGGGVGFVALRGSKKAGAPPVKPAAQAIQNPAQPGSGSAVAPPNNTMQTIATIAPIAEGAINALSNLFGS